jgi:hypothetical protein
LCRAKFRPLRQRNRFADERRRGVGDLVGENRIQARFAGNPSLKTAVAATFADIGAGDKVIVTGIMAADKKSIPARAVYLMTKADIAGRQVKDQERWKTRGISGQVTAVNAQTKEITVASRGMMGETKIVLTPKDDAKFRRYAPDSVRYDEAKTSSLDEIKVGDSVRALGDKSADGTIFKAEEIVSGRSKPSAERLRRLMRRKTKLLSQTFKRKNR